MQDEAQEGFGEEITRIEVYDDSNSKLIEIKDRESVAYFAELIGETPENAREGFTFLEKLPDDARISYHYVFLSGKKAKDIYVYENYPYISLQEKESNAVLTWELSEEDSFNLQNPQIAEEANRSGMRYLQADLNELGKSRPLIMEEEAYFTWNRGTFEGFSELEEGRFEYDLRSYDASYLDFSAQSDKLFMSSFDEATKWPEKLPPGFVPEEILEKGKNPGLGIRELHNRGINGEGVGIAVIDQALVVDHREYKDNLKLYEIYHDQSFEAQMHGPAVASIAVGKTVGVAPNASLYYIASTFGEFEADGEYVQNLDIMAKCIDRILEINEVLPRDEKIRVIAIARGFEKDSDRTVYEAVERAKDKGVFVITTTTGWNYPLVHMGLGREVNSDPEAVSSYTPGLWLAESFYNGNKEKIFEGDDFLTDEFLYIPMDSRTTAGFTSNHQYTFYREGGLSWTAPWLAGMYALCVQADPEMTPEKFIKTAMETADVTVISHRGKKYELGRIINPGRLIERIKEERQ